MDEAPITENDPELADQAVEVAMDVPATAPAEGPEPEAPVAVPEPEPEEPAAEPEPEEPATEQDQLSLDEMVESLKDSDTADESGADESDEGQEPSEEPGVTPIPETSPETVEATVGPPALVRDRLAARLPFGIYLGVWAVFAGVLTYLLWSAATRSFTGSPLYAYFVLGGVALTVVGPLLGLVVWLVLRGGAEGDTGAALARAVFMRAAAATLAGDLLWWLGLVLLDLHRTGVLG